MPFHTPFFRNSLNKAVSVLLLLQAALPAVVDAESRVFPGEYLVEYAQGAKTPQALNAPIARAGNSSTEMLTDTVMLVKRLPLVGALGKSGRSSVRQASVPFDPNDSFCRELLSSGAALKCSPNYEVHLEKTTNDEYFDNLWGLTAQYGADALDAWEVETGSSETVVAVVDTGVDYTHPDLLANLWVNPGEIVGNGIDDDHNGYIDDVYGANTAAGTGDPFDNNSHGTHVSGTIGARANNGIGVTGVAWNVKIMALKFLGADGSGSLGDAVKALDYVRAMHARGVNVRIASNSWGGAGYSAILEQAVSALGKEGIFFIAAAGNEANNNDRNPVYPGALELSNVITVASHGKTKKLSSFSNFGARSVDIAAPGEQIVSTVPGGGYDAYSGTSMATPHVAGALALLYSHNPSLTMAEAREALLTSASRGKGLKNSVHLGRILNIAKLLRNEHTCISESSCAIPTGSITSLKAYGLSSAGKRLSKVASYGRALLLVNGASDGTASIAVRLNGLECTSTIEMDLEKGSGKSTLKLPELPSDVHTLTFEVDGISRTIKVSRIVQKKGKKSAKNTLFSKLASVCKKITAQ